MGTKRKINFTDHERLRSQSSLEFTQYNSLVQIYNSKSYKVKKLSKEPEKLLNKDYNDYAEYVNKDVDKTHSGVISLKTSQNELLTTASHPKRVPYNSDIIGNILMANKVRMVKNIKNKTMNLSHTMRESGSAYEINTNTYKNNDMAKITTSPIKPRLVENGIIKKQGFLNMSNGFQK